MNKHFSLPVILISFFLLLPFHARAAIEDAEKVYKVTEGEYLEALSHVKKLESRNGLLVKDNKHLEKLNGDAFVQTKKAEGVIEQLMGKVFTRKLAPEEEPAASMLANTQPLSSPETFQKEGSGEPLTFSKERSAEVSSASLFPQGQSADVGVSPQELLKENAELKQTVQALMQQLENYQKLHKIEQASLSLSEGSQTQAHPEGLKLETSVRD